jgi:hypothetical protein
MPSATRPPPPVPGDSKDWTWVLMRACPECRYDVQAFERERVGGRIRHAGSLWLNVLARNPTDLRRRPDPETWSPLEYACHVRDVFRLYSQRLAMMLEEDGPHYANWDQDATAVEKRYDLEDPAVVAASLRENADRLAAEFDRVEGEQWERTGFRSDGAAFTIETFARYFIHDPAHHLHDVGVDFGAATSG